MSEQALDLRGSMRIVRRHPLIVGIFAALGLLAGVAFAVLYPPMLTSTALVELPASAARYVGTQVVIADSSPVLALAMPRIDPPVSLQVLRGRVQAKSLTSSIISISGQGKTAAQAEDTANAVASSYVAYLGSKSAPGGRVRAAVLEPATNATGMALPVRLLVTGGLGVVVGALIGAIASLAIGRGDRRLRQRDEIADAIGVPVLASIPVGNPSDAAGWTKLFEEYEPPAVDAWRLRKALQYMGLADSNGRGSSLAVLSLSSDRKALALGPQLAVFAASLGVPTALVVGPQQDGNATAILRAACTGSSILSKRLKNLRLVATDHDNEMPGAVLTVAVAVVEGQAPQVADTMHTTTTVLGVSAGAVTAEQLARVAASAAADGRDIVGILVADPDPADHTSGRIPQVARSAHRKMPTRLSGAPSETRW